MIDTAAAAATKFTIKPLKFKKVNAEARIETTAPGFGIYALENGTFESFNSTRTYKTLEKAQAAVQAEYLRDTRKRLEAAN